MPAVRVPAVRSAQAGGTSAVPPSAPANQKRGARQVVRTAGFQPAPFDYNAYVPTVRTRGKLPHWEQDNAVYFVTFRLADSLPKSVLRAFEFERKNILATAEQMGRRLSPSEEARLDELFSDQIQTKLDAGIGHCFLVKPSVGKLVAEVLQHFNLCRYRLYAWCVMPNHVHVLFRIFERHALAGIVHAWKSYSSNGANRILNRSGRFWQREYYDHIVRSEDEFYRIVSYIAENPKRAGLRDWPWIGVDLRK